MRRVLVAITLIAGVAACGGAQSMSPPSSPSMAAAPPPPPPSPAMGGKPGGQPWASVLAKTTPGTPAGPASAPHVAMMLIYTAHLTLAVFQVEAGLDSVEALARSGGGSLSNRADTQVTIRVPRARFDEALGSVEKHGDVLHRDVTAEDVTDEYADLDVRLKNARAMRDRLQQLLQNAAVKEAIDIEKELGRVTEDIERMEGKLKLLSDQIAFSTITVTFQPIDQNPVHDLARLPLPWLKDLGLAELLNVKEATP